MTHQMLRIRLFKVHRVLQFTTNWQMCLGSNWQYWLVLERLITWPHDSAVLSNSR